MTLSVRRRALVVAALLAALAAAIASTHGSTGAATRVDQAVTALVEGPSPIIVEH